MVEAKGSQDAIVPDSYKPAADVNVMTLPYDVLFELFQFLWRDGIGRLMRTCKTMHKHGIRTLLQDEIWITWRTIKSFCLFMNADVTRCEHLRALSLPPFDEELNSNLQFLAQVLQRASNLRKIEVSAELLTNYPSMLDAVAKMELLQDLSVRQWSQQVGLLLASTKSPVRSLNVDCSPPDRDAADLYTEFLPHLAHLQHSIEKLSVEWVTWDEAPAGLCLAKVHTLYVNYCDATDIMPLVTVFPALKRLIVWTDEEFYSFEDNLDDIRSENISDQQLIGSWPSLDYARFSPNLLYTLAPICKVTTLRTSCPDLDTSLPWDRWEDALASISPENLHLEVRREQDLIAMVFTRLPGMIRLSLDIDLTREWISPMEDIFVVLHTLLSSRTSLTHINLTLRWKEYLLTTFVQEEDQPEPEPDTPSPQRVFLRGLDRFAMAQTIGHRLPSLKYIRLNILPNEEDKYDTAGPFWTVETVDGRRYLTELSDEEGLKALGIWE